MAKTIYHIGIDPGRKYACAIMRNNAKLKTTISLYETREKTVRALRSVLSTIKDLSCINAWIEDVGAMAYVKVDKLTGKKTLTSQKGSANFGFGFDTGVIHGVFMSYDVELRTVKPKIWLREFNIPPRSKPSDIPYFQPARVMFPSLSAELKYKTKDHDKAAALLICEYGRRVVECELKGRAVNRIPGNYEFERVEA